jgi:hypothetical protein
VDFFIILSDVSPMFAAGGGQLNPVHVACLYFVQVQLYTAAGRLSGNKLLLFARNLELSLIFD